MKFYDCITAPSPQRARMFIAEKGLDIDTVQIDLGQGEQFGEAYRAINPRCTVPALVLDDGTVLCDNAGIAAYLEAYCPNPPLLGSTPVEKALVASWNSRCDLEGMMAIAEAFRNFARGLKGRALTGPTNYEQIPELVERGRKRTAEFLESLNQRLGESTFLAGDFFSVADISAYIAVGFAGRIKISANDDQHHLRRWHDLVAARPSAQSL